MWVNFYLGDRKNCVAIFGKSITLLDLLRVIKQINVDLMFRKKSWLKQVFFFFNQKMHLVLCKGLPLIITLYI